MVKILSRVINWNLEIKEWNVEPLADDHKERDKGKVTAKVDRREFLY